MRNNQPVTNIETPVPEGRFIYSRTDLHGNITDANDLFIELSDFSRDELIGAPHNLIRHPDMPSEAFADLWRALKAGDPWSGYVENRRKDGGFYWVHAFASPIRKNGHVVGFDSVRRTVPKDTVRKIERGYQRVRTGKGLTVENGRLVRKGLLGRLYGISLSAHLQSALAFIALMLALLLVPAVNNALEAGGTSLAGVVIIGAAALLMLGYLALHFVPRMTRDLDAMRKVMAATQRDGDLRRIVASNRRDDIGHIAHAY